MTRPYAPPASDDEAATGGAALRRIRKSRKLTLEQLSQLTGIPTSSLSRIENTRLRLTVDKMHLLAKALDVPVERLLDRLAADQTDRPLLNDGDPAIKLGALAEVRRPVYEQVATPRVDASADPEAVVLAVEQVLAGPVASAS